MDLNEIWRNVLGDLQVSVTRANFVTWFKNTFIYDCKKGVYTIGVPNFFYEDWLKKHHLKDIQGALSHQTKEQVMAVKFKVANPSSEQSVTFDKSKVIHRAVDNQPSKKVSLRPQSLPQNSSLNDLYLFENFVVGSSNQLAYAAADAVAKKPGQIYNPLFIYGESGLGKTHLMQAIGNEVVKISNAKVLYITTEEFLNDFINAVESGAGKAKDFKNRYRNVDVLLIDDVQFFSGKESTQEEFFHTFNRLHQNKKQVVLAADRYPKAIRGLEKRLQTRFEGGMVADIGEPDFETRAAILRQKAKKHQIEFPDEVIEYLAQNIKSSVRELEGALTKISASCEIKNYSPTVEIATEVLGNIISEIRQTITPDLIIRESCRYFKVSREDLLGSRRSKEIVYPRQITMYLIRSETNLSYPVIGREMGGKDHTTTLYGCKKIESEINSNPKLKEDIFFIKEKIRLVN